MDATPFPRSMSNEALLYFWAIGDLHYRALPVWHDVHTRRLAHMYQDLHDLWQKEGRPAFCVSPGDLVETCSLKDQQLARASIEAQLGTIPFYPGIGNHEYMGPEAEDPAYVATISDSVWAKPLRYSWQVGNTICIMLDYPNPFMTENPLYVYISQETLKFLDTTLAKHATQPAIIFLHCPLHNTVLDRNVERHRDYNSLQNFFAPENSQEVRDILARHANAGLVFGGHTHSGWEAPNLVCTENLGGHPVSFINLMSPWYTGTHTGPRLNADDTSIEYIPDTPDVIPTFSVRLYQDQAIIRLRDHRLQKWLKEWNVPLQTTL